MINKDNNDFNCNPGYGNTEIGAGSLHDFLLVLREKLWYFIVAFLSALTCGFIYCYKATPIYEAATMIQVLRDDNSILGVKTIESADIKSAKDLNTQVKILESLRIVEEVASELKGADLEAVMEPYKDRSELLGPLTTAGVLARNRRVIPMRTSLMVGVAYEHPDPNIAAKIANLFAEKYIAYKVKLDIENSMKAVDDLKVRADQQRIKVEDIENKMAMYRESNATVSLEAQADIEHKALNDINTALTAAKIAFDAAKSRMDMIINYRKENKDIINIPFIADNPQVRSLSLELASKNIDINTFSERYGVKHPRMIAAFNAKEQVELELKEAVKRTEKQIENDFIEKKQVVDIAISSLKEKENAIINLSKLRVEYNSLVRDLEVNQALYQSLVMRMNTEIAQIDLVKPNARIIDRAGVPVLPVKPRKLFVMACSLIFGLISGICIVLVMGYLDDRARSSYDIENVLGLSLLGIVPRMKKGNPTEKAHIVADGGDRSVVEAFRGIHSSLKVNHIGKTAKVIITTSTQPSEGKTFFSINLASTFCQHEEKTIIIDGDLRIPRVGEMLGRLESKGVIQYCDGNASLHEVIQQNVLSGIDLISSGGRSDHPTKIVSGKKFGDMLEELRNHYDRIIIDSPPLGAVSDALNMLSKADGLVYVVKFNATNRRAIRRNLQRIRESQTPIIGAVINQVSASMSNYYYDISYTSSYVKDMPKNKKAA